MSTTYAGDPDNFPSSITIPSDGDTKPAASVNAAFEGLADRTAWLSDNLSVIRTYLSSYDVDGGTLGTVASTLYDTVSSSFRVDSSAFQPARLGDQLVIDAAFDVLLVPGSGSPKNADVQLMIVEDDGGVTDVSTEGRMHIASDPNDDTLLVREVGSIHWVHNVVNPGPFFVIVQAKVGNSSSASIAFLQSAQLRVMHVRPFLVV